MDKTKQLIDFCNIYLKSLNENDISGTDDWIVFEKYDINFFGSYYSDKVNDKQLFVEVYELLPRTESRDSIFTFIVG